MKKEKLDLETYMVADDLRDRLFRKRPEKLSNAIQLAERLNVEDHAEIQECLLRIGIMTPVLIDEYDRIIAGHGLVAAAKLIGLDDIPVLRLEDLAAEELILFQIMTEHFYSLAGIDPEILQVDIQLLSNAGKLAA